jgi:hypothetical protein
MRELTLFETGYLAGGLVLSLVLPLLMSVRNPQDAAIRRSSFKIVWVGQILLASTGLTVLAWASLAHYAAAVGLVSWMVCVPILHRKLRTAQTT